MIKRFTEFVNEGLGWQGGPEEKRISDALLALERSCRAGNSTRHLLPSLRELTDLFHSEGMAAAGQIVQGLEPIQREINQSWDTAEEANLKADSRGIKTAPTSQVSQVLRLFRDFNTDF